MTLGSAVLVAGLDVGTSGVKATLVEVDGNLATERVSTSVAYRADGEPSRDPDRWLTASLEALSELTVEDPHSIEGIGFTGQMHALVLLGAEGGPLRPALLWLDYEGTNNCRSLCGLTRSSTLSAARATWPWPILPSPSGFTPWRQRRVWLGRFGPWSVPRTM